MSDREFRVGFLFCGLGAGARGFLESRARLREHGARFVSVGGVDVDAEACADFARLTGGPPGRRADVATMTAEELRTAWGERAPDCVFMSPPCKGFSGLLSAAAASAEKYQRLNELVVQGVALVCRSWAAPPAMLVIENVPRITSRGAALLHEVKKLLRGYGYVLHDGHHECGELGGLAQRRRRYLLVARLLRAVPGFVYLPEKQRVRACGEVLGPLPLPGDGVAGPMHALPGISWMNWVRLAMIPAGGDWRDLPGGPRWRGRDGYYAGLLRVQDWRQPSGTVTGSRAHGSVAVADPRDFGGGPLGVTRWEDPAGTVTGQSLPSNGSASVADPRADWFKHCLRVGRWEEPVGTITSSPSPSSGAAAVADPRAFLPQGTGAHRNKFRVGRWEGPAQTIIGATRPGSGAPSVADPRVPFNDAHRVADWRAPAPAVTGARGGGPGVADPRAFLPARAVIGGPSNGADAVADPRLGCAPRPGACGVVSWAQAAATITGSMAIDNGPAAVADVRVVEALVAQVERGDYPLIVAEDGTWHRPLTTLELAALQGLPPVLDGAPLLLAGASTTRWRERIGNAVPVGAARAIGDVLLAALLAGSLGSFALGLTGVWVRERYEDAAMRLEACA